MDRMLNILALAASLAALAQPATAAPFKDRDQCLARAEALPDFAYEEAKLWEKAGGGTEAKVCQAVALLLRGDWKPAAEAFEALAPALADEPALVRANLWGRAGLAWQNAGEPKRAEAAYGKAVGILPDDPQLRLDRAVALAEQQRWWDVVADLDAAIARNPKLAEAYLLRAQAHRKLAQDHDALLDVARALDAQPENAEAHLLRGTLKADKGDLAGARADWTRARQLGGNGTTAQQATDNLNALDQAEEKAKKRG